MERAYRRATAADADFLVPALVAAERSGGDRSMYERVFGLDGDGLAALFAGLLAEDVPGSELCCESFWVALEGGERAGCIAT